ncbi:hypothetical protein [Methylobacterium haplocladii]|uniref:Morphogenetic protein n=1 Tax=Methylobacterium haplocladii TaxID=1176176 RepID=A0A512ISA5_9HYPH|nr:hypothetical protein [Methylobacterium haplocladii]GEP00588.1 hypothetical protein MHA02_29750 [Methylobacterium haplocladii]GJD85503.1 hypothetical protein HPGCJGGD_3392 [Methylobacterium haplocladii]GLS57736.1 hypothetical protein GCM10007887_03920 [Methylobacterium haplocladii]
MTDRPMIFSAPMVRALLEGRKSQTRRLLKGGVPEAPGMGVHPSHVANRPAPYLDAYCSERKSVANPRGMSTLWCWWTRDDRMGRDFRVAYKPGDRLWVRENCRAEELPEGQDGVRFRADDTFVNIAANRDAADAWLALFYYRGRGKAGIGNPVPSIHMPRWASRLTLLVTDVKVERLQDISEADAQAEGAVGMPTWGSHRNGFNAIWLDIHGAESWNANPWIVGVSFEVVRANIDALPAARAA